MNSLIFLATLGQRPAAITVALDILSKQHDYETVGILHTHPDDSDISDALNNLADVLDSHFAHLSVHYHEMRFGNGKPLLDIYNQQTAEAYYLALLETLYRYKQSRKRIHLLVAGGRKAMSVYATLAASLLFNAHDAVMTVLTPPDLMKSGIPIAPADRVDDISIVQLPLMPSRLPANTLSSWSLEDILALRRDPQVRFLEKLSKQEQILIDMLKLYPYETNLELANHLIKSERTVENQFRSIYQKMETFFEMKLDTNRKRQALLDIVIGRY